jgi:N-acetylglucosaminylphosphatidylinositol deacetylase
MSLGLRQEDDVFIIESPYVHFHCDPQGCNSRLVLIRSSDFQDSMTITWDKVKIASLLSAAFAPNLAKPMKSKGIEAPTATIDVLVTFDSTGVSSHHFISSLIHNRPGWQCPVDLYTLTSINIARKYTSFLDSIVSILTMAVRQRQSGDHPSPLLFMSGVGEVRIAQKAMTTAHQSQMKWFRWGWIGLSRYMVVNDLTLEKVTAP